MNMMGLPMVPIHQARCYTRQLSLHISCGCYMTVPLVLNLGSLPGFRWWPTQLRSVLYFRRRRELPLSFTST